MRITGLMRRLSLIGIDAIWQLSLGCLLMRTIASFLRYTGYLNFINGPINRVLLLILVHVQLLSCLLFWSIKNSGGILNKLKSRGFLASGLSTYAVSGSSPQLTLKKGAPGDQVWDLLCVQLASYLERGPLMWMMPLHLHVNQKSDYDIYDFSTLYTTLPHNLIKEKLTELIEQTFNRECSLYLACNDKNAFLTSEQPKRYKLWSCQKMCDALHYLLDNIFIRFGSKLYRQIVGIPMGTNCAPLVADLFCFKRDFMLCLTIIKLILLNLLTQPPDI